MYTIIIEPENTARHAREYQVLLSWFQRRQHELGIDQMTDGDPMDPHHPYNQAFDALCKEAEHYWRRERNYWPSPLQLSHAFFQMEDPIRPDNLTA
jgi:hypothetical protein